MTHKVYLITHLDNGMKYVGYTSKDLRTRWQQHCNDPKSAVYEAIRREGYRMTMELLGEFDTKIEALRKEQEYIRTLNTLAPNGWNVQEREIPASAPKKWIKIQEPIKLDDGWNPESKLACPSCKNHDGMTHHEHVEVYIRHGDSWHAPGTRYSINRRTVVTDADMTNNPSYRRDGIRIYFSCENCGAGQEDMPYNEILISQHKGNTLISVVYYIEDKS